jgi:hypothetical protein
VTAWRQEVAFKNKKVDFKNEKNRKPCLEGVTALLEGFPEKPIEENMIF